ncbi:MAG: hypothetical protein MK226_02565 [Saprospiraceae bacterium]|nr:hypothetical protein [Saprospiraceae bacterium]
MKNSHLIFILRTFSKKEVRDFRKWNQSPSHNQRDDVISLFEYLVAGNHLAEEKYLKKERIYSKLFPKSEFDDARLRQTMHFLLKSIEEYLIYKEFREDQVQAKLVLAGIYRKRKLDKVFQRTINGIQQLQERSELRDEVYLRNEYLLQKSLYDFLSEKKRTTSINLQEVSDALDITFCADKLRQACLMLAHQKVYKAEYNMGILGHIISYVENNNYLEIPAISIYYFIYKASKEKEDTSFFEKLKSAIIENGQLFPSNERRDIYLMAINYCISKLNIGKREFIREAFELYRQGLEDETLVDGNVLTQFTFSNIVNIGCVLKEYVWVESFIKNYQQYLPNKYRESYVTLTTARLYFDKGDYQRAMKLLAQFDDDDVIVTLNGKAMLLKMYYEEKEDDALESLLESMRNYVHRKKMIGYYKDIYSNLIKYTRKLLRINPYDKKQKEKLRKEINEANPLPERKWLMEQLEKI